MKHASHLTNSLTVDRFCAVKIADLNFKEESGRPDDQGALWIAPVIKTGWDAPAGLLALYASTNGDPILLGQIEDGDLTWVNGNDRDSGMDESIKEVLLRSHWIHRNDGEGYSYLVMDAAASWSDE
jgi:hypothetical protein